ncbi:MAG: hypothetical protein AUI11_05870 [Acidobacteria bacterium 13_2_20CM_2_66_4]|nr:MAG: hypothetical protein AUI11_05870 [Acidobacteria bacterium 13_2_20CM_2_66_4]
MTYVALLRAINLAGRNRVAMSALREFAEALDSASEWESIVARNPFRNEAKRDPGHLVAVFLKDSPDRTRAAALHAAIVGRETARVDGREAYIVFPDGIGRSRLTSMLIEKALGTRGTARNWNTVLKLGSLMAAI